MGEQNVKMSGYTLPKPSSPKKILYTTFALNEKSHITVALLLKIRVCFTATTIACCHFCQ
jgi:hypothetical protein